MKTTEIKAVTPFQKIAEASKTTGFSQYWLREGCKSGAVPCVRAGKKYMINVPALLAQYGVADGVTNY